MSERSTPFGGRASLVALLLGALTLATSGCTRLILSLPDSVPEDAYEVRKSVALAVESDRALAVLVAALGRSRTPLGYRLRADVSDGRIRYAWRIGILSSRTVEKEFDLPFAETDARIVDLSQVGGRLGVKFRRNGEDVPFAYISVASREDAETIVDALAILRAGA